MTSLAVLRAALTLTVVVVAADAHAGQATCSNPGLPVGAAASSDLLPGRLTLGLTNAFLSVDSTELVDDARGPVRYDAGLLLVETRVSAELAVRPWLAAGFALPYRVVVVDATYRDPATGAVVTPASAGIHVRDERLAGVGDPSLHARVARELGAYRVHARLGATLPLGHTEADNPHLLGAIGQEHQHVQLGTGTVIPFVAGEVQRPLGPVTAAAWGLVYASLYENAHGYRAGHRLSGGVTGSSGLGTRAWTFGVAAEAHGETAERWDGLVYEDEGNAGRVDILVGGSAAWRPLRNLALVADVKAPVYSHVVGNQVDYGMFVGFGVVASFDVLPRPSYRGVDEQVVGPPGSASPLVPVAGKLTVFDLWADWCAPCRELDAGLAALARAHPDRLAVRKLDITDPDSAAWARYLAPGGFELPHVKVYGPDGTLRFEATAPPAELVRRIEAELD